MLFIGLLPFHEGLCADSAAVQIDIPRQPLGDALQSLALQADIQVFFEDELLAGRESPDLSGLMAPEQALRRLLAGTGLHYVADARGAMVIQRDPAASPASVVPARTPAPPPAPDALLPLAPEPVPASPAWALRLRGQFAGPDHWIAEAGVEYFFTRAWSTGLSIGQRRRIGEVHPLPLSWSLNYSLRPGLDWRPYAGAGVSHTRYRGSLSDTGPLMLAGLDVRLSHRWFLNSEIKWQRREAARMPLGPWRFAVGVTYRPGDQAAARE